MKPRLFVVAMLFVTLFSLSLVARGSQLSDSSLSAPAVALGQPGLSFRYVQTFGVTEHAYTADAQHLNGPDGIFIDSSGNLYVVEGAGGRMLKFNSSGNLVLSIGEAGYNRTSDTTFDTPRGVAVDGNGNIWVTDNNRVTEYDVNGAYLREVGDWWSGSDQTHFDTPRGVALNGGRVYVSDTYNHRVQVYQLISGSPVYSTTIGETGNSGSDNSHFSEPAQIAFDSSGRLYVVDTANYRVQRCAFASSWTCSTFFGVTGVPGNDLTHMDWAYGITIDSNDNIFIADGLNYRVLKCNTSGVCTHLTGTTGERGWDNAHFWWPADVAIDHSGNVFVSDYDNHRIQKFGSTGIYSSTIGVTRQPYVVDTSHYNSPNGITVAADGSLYFTENRGYRLVKLNAAGTQQWVIGEAGIYGADNLHFGDYWSGPEGTLAIDTNGHIYVPDTGNRRVQIFNPDGSYYATMGVAREPGSDNAHFDCPMGVAISPVNGDIYVADRCSHRVQIFDSSRVYKATLGVTQVSGTDNSHFNGPGGVAVDMSGNVYIADTDNHRVQIFSSDLTWRATWGVTGQCLEDFDHFCKPSHIAIDIRGNIYISDQDNARVQVFDSKGAYLTSVGGVYSNGPNQFQRLGSIAVDNIGNLYVTDYFNQRIQKFAPGVPGWRQKNINGFGNRATYVATRLLAFNNRLYASTSNDVAGGGVWRSIDGTTWTQSNVNGFGVVSNTHVILGQQVFSGTLYAGTANSAAGGELWRCTTCDGADWAQVTAEGFGDVNNQIIEGTTVFSNTIYAFTDNFNTGAEVWKSSTGNSGSWTQFNADGFGDANNTYLYARAVFSGFLYAATAQWGATSPTGVEIWRTNGITWTQVNVGGFGNSNNIGGQIESFNGHLYVALNTGQIWRCAACDGSDWNEVVNNGFGDSNNGMGGFLLTANGYLYVPTSNSATGTEIWRTVDGTTWRQISIDGFGDSNNVDVWSGVLFNNRLYFGTVNYAIGGQIWQQLKQVYLPLILR